MFNSYIEKRGPFGSLTKSGSCLDKDISVLTMFSVFVVCRSAFTSMQKTTTWDVSVLGSECLYLHFYLLSFQKIDKIAFPKLERQSLQRFRSFFLK